MNFFFFYQIEGKESKWCEGLADRRANIIADIQPAFSTVLDLSGVPADNDWSKVKYKGPFYCDFDAGDDLPFVCDQFKSFLGKLDAEMDFDLTQARLYASGGKGFHIEIPQECFIPKLPKDGTSWLPYIYREMSQALIVDTLDLNVYTGKKGRQWRTVNVKRDNGCYKVPITLDEALDMNEESYREIIKAPRPLIAQSPAYCNPKLAMLFDRSKDAVTSVVRGKKKRMEKANAFLDPWKKAKQSPPTMEKIMAGEGLSEDAGFQRIAMQLAIYAVSMGMKRDDFLAKCEGLCDKHESDSFRYNSPRKRRDELSRMYEYMENDTLYDFDLGPVMRLLKPGTSAPDLGVLEREDSGDVVAEVEEAEPGEEAPAPTPMADMMKGVRKGFFMNAEGMFRRLGEVDEPVCRAVLRNVEAFYDIEEDKFSGYEFDIIVKGKRLGRKMLGSDSFTSSNNMKKFFGGLQVGYQGGDAETTALLDIMAEKAEKGGRIYSYPREGFFFIQHPEKHESHMVPVYLTQDWYKCGYDEGHPDYFKLRYRPSEAISTYRLDIHHAPALNDDMKPYIRDLFKFNRPETVVNSVGWFAAAYFRSVFLHLFNQFPMLQVFGEAGSGKTQTVFMLSKMHWYTGSCSLSTASAYTNFTIDNKVNTSHSAPAIIDEYKPRELKHIRGKLEKIKDVMKNSYAGGDTGNRGTINKGGESSLGIIKSKCAAPIIFMCEAIEMETAIIERCVLVKTSKDFITDERTAAFDRLHDSDEGKAALSATGRGILSIGFGLNLQDMKKTVEGDMIRIRASLPKDKNQKPVADRVIFNRAVVIFGWRILKKVWSDAYGSEFDQMIDDLINDRLEDHNVSDESRALRVHGRSEIGKTISQIALLSREQDRPYELRLGKDYLVGDGWVEVKVERAYSVYRLYCASTHDTPLFDSVEAFQMALDSYSPCVDAVCASSELRDDGSTESVIRLDSAKLVRDGVHAFRG